MDEKLTRTDFIAIAILSVVGTAVFIGISWLVGFIIGK